MGLDHEHRLVSKVVKDRQMTTALARGVSESWFALEENRLAWSYLATCFKDYGSVPSAPSFKGEFPSYRLLNVDEPIEFLVDQLAGHRRKQSTIRLIQDAATIIESTSDYDAALELMSRRVPAIVDEGSSSTNDVDLTDDPLTRLEDYLRLKERPDGLLGIPTGFTTIDLATAGLQGGQLVVVLALPKTGKSVLALQTAINLHEAGHVPLFQSYEMSNFEQQRRHDAMRSRVAHSRLMRGRLTGEEEARYRKMLLGMEDMKPFHLSDSVSGTTVTALSGKVAETQPDVVFVDGVYLMIDEITGTQNTPEALTNLTRNLKRLAQRIDRPVVITTQALAWKVKGRNVTADSAGYSSSFVQDADVVLALQRDDPDDDMSRTLKIVASRNCGPASAELLWDWDRGRFTEYGMED